MKKYELLFVLKPTLTEEEVASRVDFVKEILEKNKAEIDAVLSMGMKKLAYEVRKYERGTYTVFYFNAPPQAIKEIERVIRITEEIIKFFTIKFESKKEITHWEKLVDGVKNKKDAPKAEKTPKAVQEEA